MEIRLIYSQTDPHQRALRDFLVEFLRERGIVADIQEAVEPARQDATVIINGEPVTERRSSPRISTNRLQSRLEQLAGALERHSWSF